MCGRDAVYRLIMRNDNDKWNEPQGLKNKLYIAVIGTTLGWGQNRTVKPFPFPRELQEVQQPLITLETCQRAWGVFERLAGRPGNETRVNTSVAVTDSMVCTDGFDGAGPCFFDSGRKQLDIQIE